MFETSDRPRVFGVPCGVNYPREIKRGIVARLAGAPPETLARTQVYVNTDRMGRDILAAFDDGTARFLPQVSPITRIASGPAFRHLAPPVTGLRRRLELGQLVKRFLETDPQFAARSSVYQLADNLALLMAEMYDEAVPVERLHELDVVDASGHWRKALEFLTIVSEFFDPEKGAPTVNEFRTRMAVEHLAGTWAHTPPDHPILVAGSTGSRGTTARFMELVARLPQGAVILPGVDFDTTDAVWDKIAEENAIEHPQERVIRFTQRMWISPREIAPWTETPAPNPARNRLVSLALRPAPVTDQWMREGPAFENVTGATQDVTLIEAPDPRLEATAIALALRKAAEQGKTAALVSPDRDLTRQVTAILDRWDIAPDDSAGIPLPLTPPGRLLRHIVGQLGRTLSAEDLLVLLKHPLVARGGVIDGPQATDARGFHLLWTRILETKLRKYGPVFPVGADIIAWAERSDEGDRAARVSWAHWIDNVIRTLSDTGTRPLVDHAEHLLTVASLLVSGPNSADDRELWAQNAGREARRVIEGLLLEAEHGGEMSPFDFADFFRTVLGRGMVRDPEPKHPDVLIWGTLEARALTTDLVILGGLNEGIWPAASDPDPWFNRDMRRQAGLLSPDQHIGLSAHDYQQAIGASEVILSRAIRDAEAETVGSRWLIRLTNLLDGMSDDGRAALSAMRDKGKAWVAMARELDRPTETVPLSPRPSPRPPVEARPRQLSVTRIETLIRDPYDTYASRVLKLGRLDPLTQTPDARDRGTAFHKILERFVTELSDETDDEAVRLLLSISEEVLETEVIWPAARRIWLGRIRRIARRLVSAERKRLAQGTPTATEAKGGLHIDEIDFSLSCEADRIDRADDGQYLIYDYKTGKAPSAKEVVAFRMQLHLEALMLEEGRFDDVPPGQVKQVTYVGLDSTLSETPLPLGPDDIVETRRKLVDLIRNYDNAETGYTSRRAMHRVAYPGNFDHLARFGEWSETDPSHGEELT